eukprot:GILK01000761.1.p1 GENE.GILK01000761.1~~GILK01000761.1.p1  ORF type:complete len:176 (-),score=17.93 GILK01000761.1:116-643(-)
MDASESAASRAAAEAKMSALRSSIQEFGTNSYYYAHAKTAECPAHAVKIEGPGLVTGGPPVLIERTISPPTRPVEVYKEIKSYAWADDDDNVKIYITLADEGDLTQLSAESFIFTPAEERIEFIVKGGNASYRLKFDRLHEEIVPHESHHRVRSSKVILTLKKKNTATWRELCRK